ncbi:MAG: DCC1-like thiol-disulfide oxidoreductase family protein [Bacteroidota bacterium]
MTTTQKIILYDDNCPLCCWYTGAFVKTGLLTQEGRQAFGEIDADQIATQLDLERSKDEIPLLDTQGGTTLYGIDSLLYILGQRWPWMVKIARWAPIDWFLRSLYKFISYNRRVIVASQTPEDSFDCSPQFNLFYRYLYLIFAGLVGTLGISRFLGAGEIIAYPLLVTLAFLLLISIPAMRLADIATSINYLGIMWTPYLVLGMILTICTVLSMPLLIGITTGLLIAGLMWWRRWDVANEPLEL